MACGSGKVGVRSRTDVMEGSVSSYLALDLGQGSVVRPGFRCPKGTDATH